MNSIVYLLIPVLVAVAAVLQARFMGTLDQTMGTAENVFITYAGGGLLAALFMLYLRGGNLSAWTGVPWYAFLPGVMGLIIVTGIGFTVPRLGFVTTFTVITVIQFTLAALFDHFGLLGSDIRPLDGGRLVGIVVLLVGVWLILR
ncbi:MAG: DMT family transporter [Anaerolineales bacterium]|nr:DMT family transporter [Anaerolineales bacterium]